MKTLREALTEALVESERDRLKFWNQVLLDRYGNHVLMPPDHLPDATKKEAKCQEETETQREPEESKSASAEEIRHGELNTTGGGDMKTIRQMFKEAMGPDFHWWQGSPDEWEAKEHKIAMWFGDFLREYGDYEPAPPRKEPSEPGKVEAYGVVIENLRRAGGSPLARAISNYVNTMIDAAEDKYANDIADAIKQERELETATHKDMLNGLRDEFRDAIKLERERLIDALHKGAKSGDKVANTAFYLAREVTE